jgi:hypothetical protein
VGGSLKHIVALALLAVLSGTPAVAAICAALCLPVHHGEQSRESQGCHGRSDGAPVVTSEQDVDCADHGLAGLPAMASLLAGRAHQCLDVPTVEWLEPTGALAVASSVLGRPLPAAPPTILRPASSSPVLRI